MDDKNKQTLTRLSDDIGFWLVCLAALAITAVIIFVVLIFAFCLYYGAFTYLQYHVWQ